MHPRLSNGDPAEVPRSAAEGVFFATLVALEDYHMSGDRIIERTCDDTPSHFYNRIVGLPNIKGTGLDVAYRWLGLRRISLRGPPPAELRLCGRYRPGRDVRGRGLRSGHRTDRACHQDVVRLPGPNRRRLQVIANDGARPRSAPAVPEQQNRGLMLGSG